MLRKLATGPGGDKPELAREKGAGWWIGNYRVSSRYATELTRFCVVRLAHGTLGEYEIWEINEDGEALLKDENYEPRIVTELRKQRNA